MGPYVADFYCPAAKVVIEVDGLIHDFASAVAHDCRRDDYMRRVGLRVIRVPARDIYADPDTVAQSLIEMCAGMIGPSTTQLR